MAGSAAARRYARALFGLARESDRVEDTRRELAELTELVDAQQELHDVLLRPLYSADRRKAVLRAVAERLGSDATLQHFFAYLIDQRRIVDLPAIRSEFDTLADEAAGRAEARVRSASPLDDAARQRLAQALTARTGREVKLHVEVDPELIGGVVAQVGDLVFDGSIRTQLEQLRESLVKA